MKPTVKVDGYPLAEAYEFLEPGDDYKLVYSNNVKCGKATVHVVCLKDHMIPPEDGHFIIKPAKAVVNKLDVGKKKVKVTVKNQKASGLTGYQISYKVKGTKKWKSVYSTSNVKTIAKLKKGKKYQVKVRGYVKVNGQKYYGN